MNTRIIKIRENAGLTQQEFADRIGVAQSTIAGYERGVRIPKELFIRKLCQEFNVNEDWLRTGAGGDENMLNVIFEEDEYIKYALELANGEHEFIRKAIIKYGKLSDGNKKIIGEFLDSLLNDK